MRVCYALWHRVSSSARVPARQPQTLLAAAAPAGASGARAANTASASTPNAALRAPKPPPGVWTTLQLQQLPAPLAHQLRVRALRRALRRLGADKQQQQEGRGVEGGRVAAERWEWSLQLEHTA